MAGHEHGAIERCKQETLTSTVVRNGKHPGMSEPQGMLDAQADLSSHLLRGQKTLRA